MLLIPCPWCGPRDEPEFSFGGEPATRPVPAESVSDSAWADYLYVRDNDKGPHTELWCHSGGCGQWFVMRRDTVTHAVLSVRTCGAAP
jgi:heterotetrameric sarcosine oxidase delta subunit